MSYAKTSEDKKLEQWFINDNSNSLLRRIKLKGQIRGLKTFNISLNFPITVISGKNGSGKSTLLALAACAFHNNEKGYKLPRRKLPYYTFSDFLIQSKDEVPPEGIAVTYHIAYDNWATNKSNTERTGVKPQELTKSQGGKWTSYGNRVDRTVVFFGIDRVVPHSEKSISKSYRSAFKIALKNGCEENVGESVSRILGSKYEDFHFKSHTKYRLPFVKKENLSYSGFNMGAGENALFEIFYNIHSCPEGSLVIIDEIELGLHQQAQKRFIRELKNICLKRKLQVICTTHSPTIISEVPPSARYYIENYPSETIILTEITAEYAAGKLAGQHSKELLVYVEDSIALDILSSALNRELRSRVSIVPIGSDSAIISHLAGMRKANVSLNLMAVLDGDKKSEIPKKHELFLKKLESFKDRNIEKEWIENRITALPGGTWPEKWAMETLKNTLTREFISTIGSTEHEIKSYIEEAEVAGKHNEFKSLSNNLHFDIAHLKKLVAEHVASAKKNEFSEIIEKINAALKA